MPLPAPVIDISVACRHWTDALADAEEQCRKFAVAALGAGEAAWPVRDETRLEVSLLLADDETVRVLNRDYRGKDAPTNVLSFPALDEDRVPADGPVLLGDIAIAYETVAREAARDDKTIAQHLAHMVVHGVLHLLGYDHQEEEDALEMERLETAVLTALGIPDPYRDGEGDDEQRRFRQ